MIHRRPPIFLAVALALVAAPSPRSAQILGVPRSSGEPAAWISGSIGLLQLGSVEDGETVSFWDFGVGAQYRASLEWGISRQSSIGVTATFARMPLTYSSMLASSCPRCDAHADVQSAVASFHMGGGAGFHQVIELQLGVTRYANFRADRIDLDLPPDADTDLLFGIGYGFGYGFGSRTQIMIVQDYGTSLHQREGLAGGTRTTAQHLITRLGVRYGIGTK